MCSCLELENVGQALSYLDDDEKSSINPNIITADVGFDAMMKDAHTPMRSVIPEAGRGGRPLSLVSEPGLYSLILRSRKPEAKTFKQWITHEVIPAIRKTGTYTANSAKLDPEAVLKKYGLSVDDPNINQNVRIELTKMAIRIARMTPEQEQRIFAIFAKLCVITMAHKKREQEADPANLFIRERLARDSGKIQAKVLY